MFPGWPTQPVLLTPHLTCMGHLQLPHGTVGAVAIDSQGRLAAATSTGGRTCKYDGRIGDTPIIGAGNWASDLVAVGALATS